MKLPNCKAKRGVYAVVESGTYVEATEEMEAEELNRRQTSPKKKRAKNKYSVCLSVCL